MSITAADLINAIYVVCGVCKEGKDVDGPDLQAWVAAHEQCNNPVDGLEYGISGRTFLSTYLCDGYIDVDREGLKPIPVPDATPLVPQSDKKAPPFGFPGGAREALRIQRAVRREMESGAAAPERVPSLPWQQRITTADLALTDAARLVTREIVSGLSEQYRQLGLPEGLTIGIESRVGDLVRLYVHSIVPHLMGMHGEGQRDARPVETQDDAD